MWARYDHWTRMATHLTTHRAGFSAGLTEITRVEESEDATGIGLSILRLAAGESAAFVATCETAWLLMEGAAEVRAGGISARWTRASLFDEGPSAVHVSAGAEVEFRAETGVELARFETASVRRFAPKMYAPLDVRDEHRGKGQVRGACHRIVRTIFDRENADRESELVLGEVVTLPGRWSSYPPHHHRQPEIYHYRFTDPRGYGHAELGETVLKVRHNDTIKIFHPNDHAQVAAPGYGMYYSWVIRHLPGDPYDVPEFDPEHTWVMEPGAKTWWPEGVE
jgi:5-deoxy-glucuronate isomerase